MTNIYDRSANRFADVLRHYAAEDAGCLLDLLTDARHWCDRQGECYGDLDRAARHRYLAERAESEP